MKKDISNKEDIEKMVVVFYNKVKKDKILGNIFNDVAKVDWEKHLPLMCDFWNNILFYAEGYEGNTMTIHTHLNEITEINRKHFKRWNKLFFQSVDELFEGEKAELIKKRATNIGDLMQKNIFNR